MVTVTNDIFYNKYIVLSGPVRTQVRHFRCSSSGTGVSKYNFMFFNHLVFCHNLFNLLSLTLPPLVLSQPPIL